MKGRSEGFLKKNYRWKRTRKSIKGKQDPVGLEIKKNDLEMLEFAAAAGEICLKYLDESGFSLWSEVLYTWAKVGEQKRIEQSKKKGKRLNICGLLELNKSFKYGLALKSFKSESFIKIIDLALESSERLKTTGQITIIVLDQGPIHKSKLTRSKVEKWEKQGLYMFLLPSYSPELNPIENEWQRLKEDEIAGRVFEDEYELILAVIAAIESRNISQGMIVERFHFPSKK